MGNEIAKAAEAPPQLPMDVMMEIFSWLPIESVMRCKSLSKQFYSCIQNPDFVQKHHDRATSIRLKDENYQIKSQFKGLIVGKTNNSGVCHIRNPATRQILVLPNPHNDTYRLHPAYYHHHQCLSDCKLLAMHGFQNTGIGLEILTLNQKDKHWRLLRKAFNSGGVIKNLGYLVEEPNYVWIVEVHKNGSLTWLEANSVDIMKEQITPWASTLPTGMFSDLLNVWALRWDGCLAIADITDRALNVLVLQKVDVVKMIRKWSQNKVVVPLKIRKGELDNFRPCNKSSHKLTFKTINDNRGHFQWCEYDMELGKLSDKYTHNYIPMKPSLFTLDGMVPEK